MLQIQQRDKATHVTCSLQSNGKEVIFLNYGCLNIWIQYEKNSTFNKLFYKANNSTYFKIYRPNS